MWRGRTYRTAFMRVMLRLTAAAVVLAGVASGAFGLVYWLVGHAGIRHSFVAATLPTGEMGEHLDGLGDLTVFSIYTLFHSGYASYLPHGLDKLVASVELGIGWLGQLVLLLWALVQLLPGAGGDEASGTDPRPPRTRR